MLLKLLWKETGKANDSDCTWEGKLVRGVGGSLSSFSKFEPVNIIPIQTIRCKIEYVSILKKNVLPQGKRL